MRTRCVPRTRISALSVDKSGAFAPRIGSWQGRTRELQSQPHKLGLGWTTLGKLTPMNSQHLHLALTTPLEELLTIPQGVQLAHNVREGLEGIAPEQAVAILRAINGMIESGLQAERDASGDELITRDENRDVEWLMQALADENHLIPAGQPHIPNHIYFLVMAAFKLGGVVEQRLSYKTTHFPAAAVATLLEAQEAWAYAELLPSAQPVRETIETAWSRGLTPDSLGSEDFKKLQSKQAKKAADSRHQSNRIAKQRALELYFATNHSTIDAAAASIASQVFRAPGTVRNWIFAARRARGMNGE